MDEQAAFWYSMWRRLKLFVYSDSGAGKTTLAVQFPQTAIIDLEGGTDHYGELSNFDVLHARTADVWARDRLFAHSPTPLQEPRR